MSRDIALAHGGDLSVRSKLGEGTVFSLDLPAAEMESLEEARLIAAGQHGGQP